MTVNSSEDVALSAKVQDKASISGVSRETQGQRSASFSRSGNKRPPTLSDIATRYVEEATLLSVDQNFC